MAPLNRFFQKLPKIKIWHHFVIEKPAATPTFCKRNVSTMNHIEMLNFLTFRLTIGVQHFGKNGHVIQFSKKIKVCIGHKYDV